MLVMVPISVAGALLLASASPFMDDDIAQVRRESIAVVAGGEVREGATTAA